MKEILKTILISGIAIMSGCGGDDINISPALPGIGGSMARFGISGDHLYTTDGQNLQIYDISDQADPKPGGKIHVSNIEVETIFPYQKNLFIGSQSGMYIFDVSNPSDPVRVSFYSHVTSCDPVAVSGNYAYVTTRTDTNCRFGSNFLEVLDVTDLSNPKNIGMYPMLHPHGLGVDQTTLFVCEGDYGLKIFDATNPEKLIETQHIDEFEGFDVIPINNRLLIIGKDGLYQYDYSDLKNLNLLSKIEVKKTLQD